MSISVYVRGPVHDASLSALCPCKNLCLRLWCCKTPLRALFCRLGP
jgi:hypothetical protein